MSRFKTDFIAVTRVSTILGIIATLLLTGSFNIHPTLASGPSIWTVNVLTDSSLTTCVANSGSGGATCELRDAINKAASGDTINFSVSGTLSITSTLPVIAKTVTINGTGQGVTIDGGGSHQILSVNGSGNLSLTALTLSNGSSSISGGAVSNVGGILNITNSTFSSNAAGSYGGAILNAGTLNVINSTFSGNSAGSSGGGAIDSGATANIANSTFFANSTTGDGGAFSNDGTLNVTNTTFYGNSSANGGVIYNTNGSTVTLNNSLIANSTGGDCSNSGTLTGTNNLSDNSCSGTIASPTNISSTLANNGGTTQTLALLIGSNAIDAVPNGSCVYSSSGTNSLFTNGATITTDQRGVGRPQGTLCDIGAFEFVSVPTSTPTSTATDTATATSTLTKTSTPTNAATPTNTTTSTSTSTPVPAKIDTIGIFRAGTFYLRLHNSTGNADLTVGFTAGTKPYPIVGDWTGSGFDTVGVFDQNNGQFTLCTANVTASCANVANTKTLVLGIPNDQPLSGRWLLSATNAGVGVFRPSNGLIYLKTGLTTGYADYTMVLGIPGDTGLAGDWNSKGFDSPGVYRPSNSTFYLSNKVINGSVYGDYQFAYGLGGDAPVVGDWIAQGNDGVGLFRQSNGFTYLKNALTTGYADNSFTYGIAGDVPVAGHWQAAYPPIAPASAASVLIAKTAIPVAPNGSIGSDGPIGD